jgi:hypothetical protein
MRTSGGAGQRSQLANSGSSSIDTCSAPLKIALDELRVVLGRERRSPSVWPISGIRCGPLGPSYHRCGRPCLAAGSGLFGLAWPDRLPAAGRVWIPCCCAWTIRMSGQRADAAETAAWRGRVRPVDSSSLLRSFGRTRPPGQLPGTPVGHLSTRHSPHHAAPVTAPARVPARPDGRPPSAGRRPAAGQR